MVDSPPGITNPSTASNSSERRTGTAVDPDVTQRCQMFAEIPLQRQHPDAHGAHCWGGRYSLGKRVSPSCMTAATISPYWLKILPWHSARPPQADGEDWS